jgi:RNA polymerase sigma factor for flagellar operon FliA
MIEAAYAQSRETVVDNDELILSELPQVYYIARRIHERLPQHVPMEDLIQAGVIGLVEAVRSYDAGKSVPLKSFAKFRIRGAILDSLRELDWGSRLMRRKGRKLEEAIATLSTRLGRRPEEDEIAEEMDISLDALHEMAFQLDGLILVGQCVQEGDKEHDVIESAPSEAESALDVCLKSERKSHLTRAIAGLSQKEQLILSLYYVEEMTMKEVAGILEVGESRVSQIHALALTKLRASMEKGASL